jgi:hypothetical protein
MNATTASAVIAVNLDCTDSTQALDREYDPIPLIS